MYKDNVNTHINKKAARCCQIRQSEGMPKLSTPFPGDKFRNKCYRLNCFRISTSMVAFFAYSQVSQRRILFFSTSISLLNPRIYRKQIRYIISIGDNHNAERPNHIFAKQVV